MKKPIKPRMGQESVWDYPRPPRLESTNKRLVVTVQDTVLADTTAGYRILETSHPPVYYIPPVDIKLELLHRQTRSSYCEYKGEAIYWDIHLNDQIIPAAAWSYPTPRPTYSAVADYLAFYPSRVGACFVDGERVQAQEGDFYGGWITSEIVGPFKGAPGTWGW